LTATLTELDAAAARGALLLDEEVTEWWRRVTPETLDMGSMCLCVLGQLFDNWRTGLVVLEIARDDADRIYALGFDLPPERPGRIVEVNDPRWPVLTDAWLREIATRS
jgi:hypothetical protein